MTDQQSNLVKTFDMMEDYMEKMWDTCFTNLSTFSWTQDQIEEMVRKQLDQNKSARDSMLKLVEELSLRMRKNQEQNWQMIESVVLDTYEQFSSANQNLMGDLPQKMQDLAKKAVFSASPLFNLNKAV